MERTRSVAHSSNWYCHRPDGGRWFGQGMLMSEVNSGLPGVGGVPWGSHFCQLYEGRDDLVEVLVPFFKAGIEADGRCLWITAEPLAVDDATAALKSAVADLDGRLARKQIEIIDHRAWYQCR